MECAGAGKVSKPMECGMARKPKAKKKKRKAGGGGGGSQGPVKGFRPGKAPPELKRQQARSQLGGDAGWAQKQAVDAVAGRSPEEVQAMVRKWMVAFLVVGVLLAVAGAFLYQWSVVAGVIVHVVTAALLVLGYRLRKQGHRLVEMSESLQ